MTESLAQEYMLLLRFQKENCLKFNNQQTNLLLKSREEYQWVE
ncbi:Uncharacterised protein [uncultured Eubacterium sp.]|nr:Uncharacterised protein [uncultured Eubacterium sp.]